MYKLLQDGKAFETLTAEGARQELLEAWSTPEQRAYNASTHTCPACNGQGYKVTRVRGQQPVRDKAGCYECLGLGKLRNEAASAARV